MHVRDQAGDLPRGSGGELGLDQRSDLRLRLGNGEIEGKRRHLVGRALLAQQLVPDLRPVPVRDYDLALADERSDRRTRLAQRRELLRNRPTPQRITAERDDDRHPRAPGRPVLPAGEAGLRSGPKPLAARCSPGPC